MSAARQRRYRQRRGDGRIVLRIAVDGVEWIESLIEAGLLRREDEDDRATVEAASAVALAKMTERANDNG